MTGAETSLTVYVTASVPETASNTVATLTEAVTGLSFWQQVVDLILSLF